MGAAFTLTLRGSSLFLLSCCKAANLASRVFSWGLSPSFPCR